MLVLSRKPDEKIVIAGNIVVTVLEIKGNQIRLGIDAPRDHQILRGELLDGSKVADATGRTEANKK